MEVKRGYKQTETGVIPHDWNQPALGSLTMLMTNGFVGTATSHYVNNENGVLYIQGYNIKENAFNFHGVKFVSEQFHRAHMKSCLRGGDLLTVQTGEVGQTTIVPDELAGSNCHALIISRFDRKHVCPAFVSQYLNSNTGRSRLRLIETGTTMKHLNVSDMLEFTIPLPPTNAEQETIAEALSDADALIKSLKQLLTKKRQIKKGAMQELLTGKKRLPGFSGEWETGTFGEIFQYHPTATNSRNDLLSAGDAFYIHYGDIHTRFHNHLDFGVVKPPRIDRSRCSNAALLKNGDWVMADASEDHKGVGKSIEIQGLDTSMAAVAGLHTFLLREKIPTFSPSFKGHLGNLKFLHDQFLRVATGMKVFGVSKAALQEIELPIPHPKEQTAIATILSGMDAEITALEARLSKTRQIKQGMMHELLTGRIRLL